jgi:threonine dehydratase
VVERVGEKARIGLVVCGGNATTADVMAWSSRFGLR